MSDRCPSELALLQLLDDPDAPGAEHVAACPRCSGRFGQLQVSAGRFERTVCAETVFNILDRRDNRALSRWLWLTPVPVFAFLLIVMVRTPEVPRGSTAANTAPTPPLTIRATGANPTARPLSLTVLDMTARTPRPLGPNEPVSANATVQLDVHVGAPCWMTVVSVDGRGRVARMFPASGDSREVKGDGPLPVRPSLDGAAGPERIFALCAPHALRFADIVRAIPLAHAQASPMKPSNSHEGSTPIAGPSSATPFAPLEDLRDVSLGDPGGMAVRRLAALPGLEAGIEQSSVLLDKKRR